MMIWELLKQMNIFIMQKLKNKSRYMYYVWFVVGACNVGALVADASDNTLRINPNICTACGYCEISCPETNCLTIKQDIIELKPTWFLKESVLAQDKLFACVECGVEFATTKNNEKKCSKMATIFASDPVKVRSLYCCAN